MFSSNVTGIPQMQMRVSCVYIASHCIPAASGAFVCLAVMRAYLLICVLMARAVALPLAGRGKQHDRILFKGRTRLLLLLLEWTGCAKYAALCEVCNCFSVCMIMCRIGIVFLTQSIVKHCAKWLKYATDSTFA